ncbi:MAG: leucyl aminopeptidase [Aeromicrobium sp.]
MPALTVSSANHLTTRADALVLGIRNDDDRGEFADRLSILNFSGEDGQVTVFPSGGTAKAPLVIVVGLPDVPTGEDLRRAAARGIKAAKGAASIAVALHPAGIDEVAAIAEGLELGAYTFDKYKTKKKGAKAPKVVKSAVIITAFARKATSGKALERASTISAAVNRARDWANSPPGDLRPPEFARQISEYVPSSVKAEVWDEKRLAKEKCGGILGVGQGSNSPPRLVKLTYSPAGATKHIALVGKGITFDSGGLSIKPGASMQTMKLDMAGAAAVVAATAAIAELGLPLRVTSFACIAENMPSGEAMRPGDVLTIRDGQTVEVHNTDAEGRLVLADGLSLAVEEKPDLIVDVATLTGACMVALGLRTSGILTNDDELAEQVFAASRTAGESMWPLPITEEMKATVKSSSIADIRQHNPKPYGGTLFAAAFLREFVGELPWVHLDIAGPSFNEGAAYDYTPVGGTGASVRTLVQLASDLA